MLFAMYLKGCDFVAVHKEMCLTPRWIIKGQVIPTTMTAKTGDREFYSKG